MPIIMAAMAAIFKSHLSLSHSWGQNLLNINIRWNSSTLKFWWVLADIIKMAAILTFFFRILPNFELKLEIPNIMLVYKFEINWSTNKNLTALTTYLEQTDGLTEKRTNRRTPRISISPAPLCGGLGQKSNAVDGYIYKLNHLASDAICFDCLLAMM
jgi:hypothetical protein